MNSNVNYTLYNLVKYVIMILETFFMFKNNNIVLIQNIQKLKEKRNEGTVIGEI